MMCMYDEKDERYYMNERLWELAEQSVVTMDIETRDDRRRANRIDIRKFAELIVRECIERVGVYRVRMDSSPDNIIQDIKEHFGVEE